MFSFILKQQQQQQQQQRRTYRGRSVFLSLMLMLSLCSQAQFSPGKLSTAHAELEGISNCTKCHEVGNKVSEQKCLDCHVEIQTLISADRGYHAYSDVKAQSCIDCHSEHHGRAFDGTRFDQDAFDHEWTGYDLEGEHGKIECRDCHKADNIKDAELAGREGTFIGLEDACLTCHADYHQGTLAEDCASCHSFNTFEEAEFFDHDQTDFRLKGQHVQVDCAECHKETTRNGKEFQEFSGVAFSACTDCHEDAHDGRFGVSCTDCHSETGWNQLRAGNRFDHGLTHFPLEGQHQQVSCAECHESGNYSEPLPFANCTDCHEDYHEGDFALDEGGVTDCDQCHDLQHKFDYSSFGLADHQDSDYPLEGAHLATPCFACHKPSEEERWDFTLESESCVACHDNIHEGFMSEPYGSISGCTDCHNTDAWSLVSFDHSQTDWPLEGAHTLANCRSCHFEDDSDRQQFKELNTDCASCHADESPHGAQFGPQENGNDCSRCHSIASDWPTDLFDHNNSQFKLEGRHAEIKCDACHKPDVGSGIIIYKIERFDCIDCHS